MWCPCCDGDTRAVIGFACLRAAEPPTRHSTCVATGSPCGATTAPGDSGCLSCTVACCVTEYGEPLRALSLPPIPRCPSHCCDLPRLAATCRDFNSAAPRHYTILPTPYYTSLLTPTTHRPTPPLRAPCLAPPLTLSSPPHHASHTLSPHRASPTASPGPSSATRSRITFTTTPPQGRRARRAG